MKTAQIVVCIVAGVLGVLAFVLGIAAEVSRIKADQVLVTLDLTCEYPNSAALPLGIVAALFIMAAQIIVNAFAGCICCGKRHDLSSGTPKTVAIICLIFSWIVCVISFALLILGAAANNPKQDQNFADGCTIPKAGILAGGACLALVTVLLSGSYFVLVTGTLGKSAAIANPFSQAQTMPTHQPQQQQQHHDQQFAFAEGRGSSYYPAYPVHVELPPKTV